jgi:hypothetical protein
MVWTGLTISVYGQGTGCCERGGELTGSIKRGKLLD